MSEWYAHFITCQCLTCKLRRCRSQEERDRVLREMHQNAMKKFRDMRKIFRKTSTWTHAS